MAVMLTGETETTLATEQIAAELDAAIQTGATVLLGYDHPRNGHSARAVRPRRVMGEGPAAYVRTFDAVRQGYRSFTLGRITSVDIIS